MVAGCQTTALHLWALGVKTKHVRRWADGRGGSLLRAHCQDPLDRNYVVCAHVRVNFVQTLMQQP